jgi:hypothetical protein
MKPMMYLTDDRDKPKDEQRHLVIAIGGNGDWYVGTSDHNGRDQQTVRICTSGGAASNCPGLGVAIADAYRAMAAGVNGEHRKHVPMRADLEDELAAWRRRFPKIEFNGFEWTEKA